jgi:hypothetical protein
MDRVPLYGDRLRHLHRRLLPFLLRKSSLFGVTNGALAVLPVKLLGVYRGSTVACFLVLARRNSNHTKPIQGQHHGRDTMQLTALAAAEQRQLEHVLQDLLTLILLCSVGDASIT